MIWIISFSGLGYVWMAMPIWIQNWKPYKKHVHSQDDTLCFSGMHEVLLPVSSSVNAELMTSPEQLNIS